MSDDFKMLVKDAWLLFRLGRQATEKNRNLANLYVAQRKVDGYKIELKTSQGRSDYFDYRNKVIKILTDD
jgi:hypothetical protein